MPSRVNTRRLALPALLTAVAALAACSQPPPTAEIRTARDAIARAEYDGATQLAPEPLQSAHAKLASAQGAVSKEEMDRARNFAEESAADADYADAISVNRKTAQSNEQLQMLQRRSGSSAPTK